MHSPRTSVVVVAVGTTSFVVGAGAAAFAAVVSCGSFSLVIRTLWPALAGFVAGGVTSTIVAIAETSD